MVLQLMFPLVELLNFQRRFVVSSQPFAFDQVPTVAAAYVGILLAILEEHTEESVISCTGQLWGN
jgi:hypothetical protein